MKLKPTTPIYIILMFVFLGCNKSDSTDAIVGTYVGNVHYTYGYQDQRNNPWVMEHIDTTYPIKFIVSKESAGVFKTTEEPAINSYITYFQYTDANIYGLSWYPTTGQPGGHLQFFPKADSVSFYCNGTSSPNGVYSSISEGWSRTFSGKKL